MVASDIKKQVWLSADLYCEASPVNLSCMVRPLVRHLKAGRLLSSFYFTAKFDNIPLIKLRFKIEQYDTERFKEEVTAFVVAHNNILHKQPAFLASVSPAELINFYDHDPASEQYGSTASFGFLEKQFCLSSEAVINLYEDPESWSYEDSLRSAFILNFTMLRVYYPDVEDRKEFLALYCHNWMPRVTWFKKDTENGHKGDTDRIRNKFEERFQLQKDSLKKIMTLILSLAPDKGAATGVQWLTNWLRATRRHKKWLHSKSFYPVKKRLINVTPVAAAEVHTTLYESYMHMNNNRLGLFNTDEAYLAYLMKRAIETFDQ